MKMWVVLPRRTSRPVVYPKRIKSEHHFSLPIEKFHLNMHAFKRALNLTKNKGELKRLNNIINSVTGFQLFAIRVVISNGFTSERNTIKKALKWLLFSKNYKTHSHL